MCFISRPCARVTIWNTMSPLVWRNFGAPVALATTLFVGRGFGVICVGSVGSMQQSASKGVLPA